MATKWIIVSLILTLSDITESSHFKGASIQWKPLDAQNFDGLIVVHQRLAWKSSLCSAADIGTTAVFGGQATLNCQSGCSGRVGRTASHCTDFNTAEEWLVGEKTYTYNIGTSVTNFEVSYASGDWIVLALGGGSWEIRVKGNLEPRSDNGLINTSPVTTFTPIRLQSGCTHNIRIPVRDIDQDVLRCRWAQWSEECSSVCNDLPGATINEDTCVITWTTPDSVGFYATAIQIEDFITSASTIPMSSVPLQFAINVFFSSQPCTGGIRPSLVPGETPPDGACIAVPFGTTYTAGIVAASGDTSVSITQFKTSSPFGLITSTVIQSQHNSTHYYSNITWTPLTNQSGLNLFCFRALSSNGFESDQSCITLFGGVPTALSSSVTPTGVFTPTASTTWSITFDQAIIRPGSSRYIRFYESESGRNAFNFNVTSAAAIYPAPGSGGRTLTFSFSPNFTAGLEHYVLLDDGVAVGDFCNEESAGVTNTSFWTFSTVPLSVNLEFEDPSLTQLETTTVECTVSGELFSLTLWRNDQLLAQVNGDYLTYSTTPQSYGTYTCAVDGLQNSSILQERVQFQLLLDDISVIQCQQLMSQYTELKEAILAILGALCQSCESLFLDNIADARLNCSTSGSRAYFTAALVYSSSDGQITATTLTNTFLTWLLSEETPALMVDGARVALNQQCPTLHSTVTEEACINVFNSAPIIAFTTMIPTTVIDSTLSSPILVSVCFLTGLVAGVIIIIVVISLFLCVRRNRTQASQPPSDGDKSVEMSMSPNEAYKTVDGRYQTGTLSQMSDDSVIYDEVPAV